MPTIPLDDNTAIEECKRLLAIISARRRLDSSWYGEETPTQEIPFNPNSGFVSGMLAMYRYARGESAPAVVVQDFRNDLLRLMFGGLATGAYALPTFERMAEKSWANAWRLAELRLAIEGHEITVVPQLAHLLGITQNALSKQLTARGFDPDENIPPVFLQTIYAEYLQRANQPPTGNDSDPRKLSSD